MIDLKNPPHHKFACPHCGCELNDIDWYMPGMRKLGKYQCPECGRKYYGDLPAGFGLYYPMLLEPQTDTVYDTYGVEWYAELMKSSFTERSSNFTVDINQRFPVERGVVLNCLDINYGHALNKLLHTEYYLEKKEFDPIVIVPSLLRWMVPDTVPEIWSVDISLSSGGDWDSQFASQLRSRVDELNQCFLDIGQELPKSGDGVSVEQFTGIQPFSLDEWNIREPMVTFIWRESSSYGDTRRFWCSLPDETTATWRSLLRAPVREIRGNINVLAEKFGYPSLSMREQAHNITQTAESIQNQYPAVDIAVAGIGTSGSFPDWISDVRYDAPTPEEEVSLCERYAKSHVAVGIHGSQMALPSIHAGAVVELVQDRKWRQYSGDIGFRSTSMIDEFLRYRMVPSTTPPSRVAHIIIGLLTDMQQNRTLNVPKYDLDDEEILQLQSNWIEQDRQLERH